MSDGIRLEIQNRTPFVMTWAHLETADTPPGRTPQNLLAQSLEPWRARVLSGMAAGRCRLVCGFHAERTQERSRVESPPLGLADEDALSVTVAYNERTETFDVTSSDARVRSERSSEGHTWAGRYRWNGVRGRTRMKREQGASGGQGR